MARIWRETARYTSKRGGTNTSPAHCRMAVVEGMADRTRDHLSFRPGAVWVDVQEIMRAKTDDLAALPLLNGAELLEDLNGVDPAFSAWLARERQRLRDHSRELAEALLLKQ